MKKALIGTIVSANTPKTAIVRVEQIKIHKLYKKRFLRHKNHKVDTSGVSVNVGQVVKIVQTKPISKEKHFKVAEIVK